VLVVAMAMVVVMVMVMVVIGSAHMSMLRQVGEPSYPMSEDW
jgi:hypothetical protein